MLPRMLVATTMVVSWHPCFCTSIHNATPQIMYVFSQGNHLYICILLSAADFSQKQTYRRSNLIGGASICISEQTCTRACTSAEWVCICMHMHTHVCIRRVLVYLHARIQRHAHAHVHPLNACVAACTCTRACASPERVCICTDQVI